MRRVGMMVCAAALGLAVVAGCSGEDEPTAEHTQEETTQAAENDGSDADTGQDTETEASGDESASEYCKKASESGQKILSPDATSADFVQVYRDIAAVAPEDIKADWTAIADSLETLQKAQEDMANADTSDPEAAMEQLNKATKEMEKVSADLEAATDAITKDLNERCGGLMGS